MSLSGLNPAVPGGAEPARDHELLDAYSEAVVAVVERVGPAVVSISVRGARSGGRRAGLREGAGSGVVFTPDGYLLTNAHVVGRYRAVTVELATGEQLQGTVLGADPELDVAVVRIARDGLPVVPLGDSDRLQVGQTAVAIGNPLGLQRSITTGIISGIGRNFEEIGLDELIQTDAAINPGNSGGPLLNSAGQVIGINTVIRADATGIGFAVPINVARDIAEQVINTGEIRRAYLAIAYRDAAMLAGYLPVSQGLYVRAVGAESGAAAAGLRPGDIITRFDGVAITSEGDYRRALRQHRPGDTVVVQGVRARTRESFTVRVRLDEQQVSTARRVRG